MEQVVRMPDRTGDNQPSARDQYGEEHFVEEFSDFAALLRGSRVLIVQDGIADNLIRAPGENGSPDTDGADGGVFEAQVIPGNDDFAVGPLLRLLRLQVPGK
jgi:hypothetical protein